LWKTLPSSSSYQHIPLYPGAVRVIILLVLVVVLLWRIDKIQRPNIKRDSIYRRRSQGDGIDLRIIMELVGYNDLLSVDDATTVTAVGLNSELSSQTLASISLNYDQSGYLSYKSCKASVLSRPSGKKKSC